MATTATDVSFDPWDREIFASPYEVYGRLRDEAPLYHNEEHGFYVVSRFEDVERMLVDRDTFISGKGAVLDVLMLGTAIPPGLFIFEDPPFHTFHRARLSRVFTPRAVHRIEVEVRDFCARTVDALDGRERFDWMAELATEVPMRVIGMLLGIPEAEQPMLRDHFIESMHTPGRKTEPFANMAKAFSAFGEYIDWRAEHPSDDLMTQMLQMEFEDETGTTRHLTRAEILTYCNLIGAAGNDTTAMLLGWMGKLLAEHPDQRRALAADPSLIGGAVEESLRCEPPAYAFARYVATDTEFHGQLLPEGSFLVCLPGAANRDPRKFGPTAEEFDIRREIDHTLSFGYGPHFCLGANLARLEARLVLEEVLPKIPDWAMEPGDLELVDGSMTRGLKRLVVTVG
jgi:cytochrome P450